MISLLVKVEAFKLLEDKDLLRDTCQYTCNILEDNAHQVSTYGRIAIGEYIEEKGLEFLQCVLDEEINFSFDFDRESIAESVRDKFPGAFVNHISGEDIECFAEVRRAWLEFLTVERDV
ncbi:hypothetical protein VPFG_00238 [Vibrio phage nt-1]|uniref:Uncharacterized protein n=1 Tax=Vibrio phage nt-1 TaxID=115992 RepID=R9TJG7_9CAUD|nr:hypothetical protein VPFG_00238 [Vibrio phage nt-1]AGN30237.1 hypothetical protein VPFG_00238 [Vibrio phage nt-1]